MWYRKAAELGNAEAQYNLGEMYCHGKGIQQDNVEACKWIYLALSRTGKEFSPRDLAGNIIEKLITPSQIAEAKKRASEWRKK